MKKRVLAAMMACAMAAGLLSGCSSEPKNPGDSNEPVVSYRITCNNGNQRTLINP